MAKSASAIDMVPFSGADEPLVHGGDLAAARRLFPDAPEPFIDLSTGINPSPYPVPDLPAEVFARLPEPAALKQLAAGRRAHLWRAVSGPCRGGAGNADSAAARLRPCAARPRGDPDPDLFRTCARRRALRSRGCRRARPRRDRRCDSGARRQSQQSRRPAFRAKPICWRSPSALRARGGLLVVDEAFMDVGPSQTSLAGDIARGSIVVLRSFGKFFGLAGLRLGFALAAPPLAARLAALLGPWAVSGPALAVGTAALADMRLDRDLATPPCRDRDAARCDFAQRRPRHRRRHGAVPAGANTRRRRTVSSSRPRRHSRPQIYRTAALAAVRPAGGRGAVATPAISDG